MTNRLDELRRGLPHVDSVVSDGGDVEDGLDAEGERLMSKFSKEADAIQNVLSWAETGVTDVNRSFDAAATRELGAERLGELGARLDQIEVKLSAVRTRLKRIAGENKQFKKDHAHRTAVVRARVVQYRQMGTRFIDVVKELEAVRGRHRQALERGVKRDIMAANPAATEGEAGRAIAEGDRAVERLMYADRGDSAQLRYQVEDVRARNSEIQKLAQNMAELNTMFVDMSILVDGQQELLNNIEYQVQEVKEKTEAAGEELVMARKHQKSRNKKKCWCMIISILILVAVAAAILIPLGRRLGWFSKKNTNNSNNNNSTNNNNGNNGNNGNNNGNNGNNNGNSGNNNGNSGNNGNNGNNNGNSNRLGAQMMRANEIRADALPVVQAAGAKSVKQLDEVASHVSHLQSVDGAKLEQETSSVRRRTR